MTISEIEQHAELKRAFPGLQQAAAEVGSPQIRNVATVGGNVCLSLPAGSLIALTAALEGVCTIWQPDGGERRVPVVDFVTGDLHGERFKKVRTPSQSAER